MTVVLHTDVVSTPPSLDTRVNSKSTIIKIVEFANSVDSDEVAHNEPPHLDLHCLSSSL